MTKTKTYKEDELPEKFAQRIGLKFNDPMLLCRALTHRSFLNEHPDAIEDNERLEFLGDAILDFIVGAWLYNELPEMPEGELTKYRAALVHTEQLAEFAKQIGLGQALRLGKGELQAGGKTKPALLCDAFEALIGALYLDQGIDAVQNFILPMISESFEDIVSNHKGEDPKSRLQEIIQAENLPIPQYVVVNELGHLQRRWVNYHPSPCYSVQGQQPQGSTCLKHCKALLTRCWNHVQRVRFGGSCHLGPAL